MIETIGINDHSECLPGEPCYAGRPAAEVPARDDRCTCSAAALELAELRGYLKGLATVAEYNRARLDELLGQAREAHAKEAR